MSKSKQTKISQTRIVGTSTCKSKVELESPAVTTGGLSRATTSTSGVKKQPALPASNIASSKSSHIKKNSEVKALQQRGFPTPRVSEITPSTTRSGTKFTITSITPTSRSSPIPPKEKKLLKAKADELEQLRRLNTELLQRVKSLEEELSTTRLSLPPSNPVSALVPVPVTEPHPTPSPSCLEDTTPQNDKKPRVLVFGDSMVRDFGGILQNLLPDYSILCNTCPGAPLSFAIKDLKNNATLNLSKRDIVFILAGSNNIPYLTPIYLEEQFQSISTLCRSSNLIISGIPYMYHSRQLNQNIFATNQFILSRSRAYHFSYFECNFFLSRGMFTRHGLHLLGPGKHVFCEKLSDVILSFQIAPASYGFILPNFAPQPCVLSELCNNDVLLSDISCPLLSETLSDIPITDLTDHTDVALAESPDSSHSSSFFR